MKKLLAILVIALVAPLTAQAVPVTYDVAYSSAIGPSGTGAFEYDSELGIMTAFIWDFGAGLTGGILDSSLDGRTVDPDTGVDEAFATIFFTVLQGTQTIYDGVLFFDPAFIGWHSRFVDFNRDGTFTFSSTNDPEIQGRFITAARLTEVPEPAPHSLFLLGLLSMALIRRRAPAGLGSNCVAPHRL